jgi:hypothetical protein
MMDPRLLAIAAMATQGISITRGDYDDPRVTLDLRPEPATCQHRPAPHLSHYETPKPLSKRAKRRAKRLSPQRLRHEGGA